MNTLFSCQSATKLALNIETTIHNKQSLKMKQKIVGKGAIYDWKLDKVLRAYLHFSPPQI